MATWFVHRRGDGSIASAHGDAQPGYAEETLDDAAGELAEWFVSAAIAPVPQEASSGQIIVALAELDWLNAVDAAVAQAGSLEQRLWARASRFPRNDVMVVAIATAIGKNSQELDDMFRLAATK